MVVGDGVTRLGEAKGKGGNGTEGREDASGNGERWGILVR